MTTAIHRDWKELWEVKRSSEVNDGYSHPFPSLYIVGDYGRRAIEKLAMGIVDIRTGMSKSSNGFVGNETHLIFSS